MMAGQGGDTSGVSSDQLGVILSYMQDHDATGAIFVGPPGSAKSMVAKATGVEGNIPTIAFDLGACKGSLVGQSEHQIRSALKVIESVSNGRSLWIATCNNIRAMPPELIRRFTLGTFFFDLPDADERKAIWKIYLAKYDLKRTLNESKAEPNLCGGDVGGWTGAEIRQCCDLAWRLDIPLADAAAYVVPVSRSAPEQLEALRKLASGRFNSASRPGVYRRTDTPPHTPHTPHTPKKRRSISANNN